MATKFKACSVQGCNGNADSYAKGSKGLCQKHYVRLTRHGDPLLGRTPSGELHRFIKSVVLCHESEECLFWPFSKGSNGRGQIFIDGKLVGVHRYVCELVNGPAPTPVHQAAHSCGKGHLGCVSKKHLRWATPKENNSDKELHGTAQRGEKNPYSKLTESDVRTIRNLLGVKSQRQIAKDFGVSQFCIHSIKSGKKWGWFSSCAES